MTGSDSVKWTLFNSQAAAYDHNTLTQPLNFYLNVIVTINFDLKSNAHDLKM